MKPTVYRPPTELMVDCRSPDPTNAINGFLWNMRRAREIGFLPSTEHSMAEHFLRGDVRVVFLDPTPLDHRILAVLGGMRDDMPSEDVAAVQRFVDRLRAETLVGNTSD